jgi:hypothetical protein
MQVPPVDSARTPPPARGGVKTKLKNLVEAIVRELDQHPGVHRSIPQLHKTHQIKRRRLYDVINIFTAIGCATRVGVDELVWGGRDKILEKFLEHKRSRGIDNTDLKLAELFPPDNSVGFASLTIAFLMLFPALATEVIDLREASAFFSRNTSKYKTILCKLYQITMILGALGVVGHTKNVCEMEILPPLARIFPNESRNPMPIGKLLNRPIAQGVEANGRKAEYLRFWKEWQLKADAQRGDRFG